MASGRHCGITEGSPHTSFSGAPPQPARTRRAPPSARLQRREHLSLGGAAEPGPPAPRPAGGRYLYKT